MTICGLARAREQDIERCVAAVEHAPKHRVHTFLATSDIHLEHKLQITREEVSPRASQRASRLATRRAAPDRQPPAGGRMPARPPTGPPCHLALALPRR